MTIRDIYEAGKDLRILEERLCQDNYIEAVILFSQMEEWFERLDNLMGSAVKPVGVNPTKEHAVLTKPYGGILAEQCLYFNVDNLWKIIVMFWPWQNRENVTIKIILETA